MIIRRITRGKGFRGVWITLLILAGYLAVGVGIAWATYGDAQATLDRELWGACFVLGLTGTAAWIITTEVVMPFVWMITRAFGKALPTLGMIFGVVAGLTLIFTVALAILLAPPDSSAADIVRFILDGLPELLVIPAILSLFWALGSDWSDLKVD